MNDREPQRLLETAEKHVIALRAIIDRRHRLSTQPLGVPSGPARPGREVRMPTELPEPKLHRSRG